jgi:hypothetical protein
VIGLVAIVKDEAPTIGRFLDALRSYVHSYTILDTGSEDGTQQAIRDCLGSVPVEWRMRQEPFVSFGSARTRLLEWARGGEDWLLMLDADMTVEWTPGWEPDPSVEAYAISVRCRQSPEFEWRMPLLLRGDLPWKSVGSVHEYTTLPDRLPAMVPTDAVRVTVEDRSSPEKTKRYAALLEAEVAADPDNSRAVFYLAQTYREMGDLRAAAMYGRRIEMGGWDQETYYAMYRRALLLAWPLSLEALLAAWEFRPARLEALHAAISELNRRSQHRTAYALASAVEGHRTSGDSLFVHSDVWAWGMDFERSIAAWWVGERDESRAIGRALLERSLPDNVRDAVVRNLSY